MQEKWFLAARNGDDKRMAELLAEQPNLIEAKDRFFSDTALHCAARAGHKTVIARLLAARPASLHARNTQLWTALDLAASKGHAKVVAQMLATDVVDLDISNGLYEAAVAGHDKVVDLLLTARRPNFTLFGNNAVLALRCMIEKGKEKNFTRMLALCPNLVDPVAKGFGSMLHQAAMYGRDNMVSQILALRPQMIDAVERDDGRNVLMRAVQGDHPTTAQTLLAIKPELIFHVSKPGNTPLHYAVTNCKELALVCKLWRLDPQALTHANNISVTPFHLAVVRRWDEVIELFQWSLPFDDIVSAFIHYKIDWQERYRPVMERLLCESSAVSLNRDVVGTVLEYIGMDVVKKRANKRAKLS